MTYHTRKAYHEIVDISTNEKSSMKNVFKVSFIVLSISLNVRGNIDVTLIGSVKYADGIGRLIIGLTDVIKDDLTINHVRLPKKQNYNFLDVDPTIEAVLKNPDPSPGNVSFLMYPLCMGSTNYSDLVPEESPIKLAYSMLESTKIPDKWTNILNEKFDAVVVPDIFYLKVYEESGVTIPIFVIPHGIYIEELLKKPTRKRNLSKPFVFGTSASFWARKNQELVIEAFHQAFGNDDKVSLVLHGRSGHKRYEKKLHDKIAELNATNITFIKSALSDEELTALFKTFDCYVLLSKGEGFSVTPREALALGIPTIISDNTAHTTICKSGCVYGVPSTIRKKAHYVGLRFGCCGEDFNCTVKDAAKALKEVYINYEHYQKKALMGRTWVKKYLWKNVKDNFLALLKPRTVVYGSVNKVENSCLMTNSRNLYTKYRQLLEK